MSSGSNPEHDTLSLERIADEFLTRLRSGHHPSIQEYTSSHPHLAEEIMELFPTLASLEQLGENTAGGAPVVDFKAPEKLGDYRIIREIGRGGMGVVYEAEHETMRRRVALKTLPVSKSKENYTKRFLREARAAGQLHHTNIVPVFEVGVSGGIHFYAMQFIHGQNLDVVLDELRRLEGVVNQTPQLGTTSDFSPALTPCLSEPASVMWSGASSVQADAWPPLGPKGINPSAACDSVTSSLQSSESSNINDSEGATHWSQVGNTSASFFRRVASGGQQVADALDYAHGCGVLHRDIKPSNLLLDTKGVLWVSDFGLAKDDSEDLTQTGDIIGTLRYMAPERFSREADIRSDIYSVGLTLYEMCTMRYAFNETGRAQLMHQIATRAPVAPRRIRPEIPRDLETIIMKSIAREPSARYQTAQALAHDLGRFLDDKPVLARRVSLAESVWRWCRRNPSYGLLFACVSLLAAIVVLGAVGFALQKSLHARQLQDETLRALAAESKARGANLESTRSLYSSYVGHAQASRWSRRRGQRFETLSELRKASELLRSLDWSDEQISQERLRLRNAAIAALPLVDIREIISWRSETSARSSLSDDGRMVAWSEDDGLLIVRDIDSNRIVAKLQGPPEQAWIVRFDPTGQFVAGKFHDDVPLTPPKLLVWNIQTGRKVLDLRDNLGRTAFAFHPRQPEISISRSSGVLETYALTDGQQVRSMPLGRDLATLRFTSEATLSHHSGRDVVLLDDKSKGTAITFPGRIKTFLWADSGDLVVGGNDGMLYVRDATSERIRAFGKHTGQIATAFLSRREDLVITDAWGGSRFIHDIATEEAVLSFDGLRVNSVAKNVDRIALSQDYRKQGVWEIATGDPLRTIHTEPGAKHWDIVPHPTYDAVVALAVPTGIEIWDIEREILLARASGKEVTQAAFSADGSKLLTASAGATAPAIWPISIVAGPMNVLAVNIGEPQQIPGLKVTRPEGRSNHLALSASGSTLAILNGMDSAHILQLGSQAEPVIVKKHRLISRIALSPDARHVVTSTWQGEGIRLWDASTGEALRDLAPTASSSWVGFSPDGKWLIATSKAHDYIWDTETWTRRKIPRGEHIGYDGRIAFSPDNKLAVVWKNQSIPRLIDPVAGAEIASLEAPSPKPGVPKFTSSGRKLVIACQGCMQVWDIEKLRTELSTLGLDW